MEICHGMYGLPQAGILASKLLPQHLGGHGYFEVQHTPGRWKHISQPIWFDLCVDNFGDKHIGSENLKHLFSVLRTEMYEIVEDWTGNLYWGINCKWNNGKHWIDIAMPIYAIKNLTRYNNPPPLKPQHCPYTPNSIIYGKENQATTPSNTSPLLNAAGKKGIQQIAGSFLYYTHLVNPTIGIALSAIATQQSAPTEETLAHVN
jgi:hypothetical protein